MHNHIQNLYLHFYIIHVNYISHFPLVLLKHFSFFFTSISIMYIYIIPHITTPLMQSSLHYGFIHFHIYHYFIYLYNPPYNHPTNAIITLLWICSFLHVSYSISTIPQMRLMVPHHIIYIYIFTYTFIISPPITLIMGK